MITNQRQYKITKAQLEKLKKAVIEFDLKESSKRLKSKLLAKAEIDALKSEYENLIDQIKEYESLESGHIKILKASTLTELPEILIKARIAKGLSQRQLADKLNMKEQQIQRYEAEGYLSANLQKLKKVADALELNISEVAEFKDSSMSYTKSSLENIEWENFPIDEMYKKGWFEDFEGSITAARTEAEMLIETFIQKAIPKLTPMLLRKRIRRSSNVNYYSILAWQCRVINIAKANKLPKKYDKNSIDDKWFIKLIQLSNYSDGPLKAKNFLESSGIYLIIEPHLSHTHLDGAAILLSDGTPIVGLTLRYDRIDNFWFVLIHELIHIVKHLRKGSLTDIYDDLDAEPDEFEQQTDRLAGEILIPSDKWESELARYVRSEDLIIEFSKKLKINPAIVAGRIRKEANNYIILKHLVGQGEVRKLFPDILFA